MDDKQFVYDLVLNVMADVMAALKKNGITKCNVGGVMRLLGVPNEEAMLHDEEFIEIDDSIEEFIDLNNSSGNTVH